MKHYKKGFLSISNCDSRGAIYEKMGPNHLGLEINPQNYQKKITTVGYGSVIERKRAIELTSISSFPPSFSLSFFSLEKATLFAFGGRNGKEKKKFPPSLFCSYIDMVFVSFFFSSPTSPLLLLSNTHTASQQLLKCEPAKL